ncbi:MAG TPA: type II toxin-antitoxin system HicA family toxin, partial [Bryobacteraceae bacterium]|nr:type II toxin-antitoxin system HicA family toxin [Bryobacteraceae bacterium]
SSISASLTDFSFFCLAIFRSPYSPGECLHRFQDTLAHLCFVPVKIRDLIRQLEAAGWQHVRTRGDHRIMRHPDGRITVVAGKPGSDVRPGAYRAILRQTGIKEPEQ